MVEINLKYLHPALKALNQHNDAILEKYKAQQHAVHSVSNAVADRQKSKLISSGNLSRGGMIAVVLIGFGVMISLIAWSLPKLVGEFKSPVTSIKPILSPPAIDEKPISSMVSNSGDDDVTDAPLPALILPTYSRDQALIGCVENESFNAPCNENVVLENGSTFTGTWSKGSANGEGSITFSDGGSIRGMWLDGTLIEIIEVNTPKAAPSIKSSVTVFKQKYVPGLGSKFSDVFVGHNFSTTNDPIWTNAYCYVSVFHGDETIRVNLSNIQNFNDKITLKKHNTNMRVSRSEFEMAQKVCPYKYTDF